MLSNIGLSVNPTSLNTFIIKYTAKANKDMSTSDTKDITIVSFN